uniref:Putative ovule protein n=1 Tax=Solanum chacoense TaxID=4108 RepID=A0A0V0HY46_SOLCH
MLYVLVNCFISNACMYMIREIVIKSYSGRNYQLLAINVLLECTSVVAIVCGCWIGTAPARIPTHILLNQVSCRYIYYYWIGYHTDTYIIYYYNIKAFESHLFGLLSYRYCNGRSWLNVPSVLRLDSAVIAIWT